MGVTISCLQVSPAPEPPGVCLESLVGILLSRDLREPGGISQLSAGGTCRRAMDLTESPQQLDWEKGSGDGRMGLLVSCSDKRFPEILILGHQRKC